MEQTCVCDEVDNNLGQKAKTVEDGGGTTLKSNYCNTFDGPL